MVSQRPAYTMSLYLVMIKSSMNMVIKPGGGLSYDVGRRTVRGSVQEVEDVYLDPSIPHQFLSVCLVKEAHCSLF